MPANYFLEHRRQRRLQQHQQQQQHYNGRRRRRGGTTDDCSILSILLFAVVFFTATSGTLYFHLQFAYNTSNLHPAGLEGNAVADSAVQSFWFSATAVAKLLDGLVFRSDAITKYYDNNNNRNSKNSHRRVIVNKNRSDSTTTAIQLEYPVEAPIANPDPIPNGVTTFSACLLVMDDNHLLVEWLAYHYHVLPLRYLIVAVDPRSKTSPTYIFNRWRREGMVIEEWTDANFWGNRDRKTISDTAPLLEKRDRHRGRQKFFYKECLIRLKQMNRTWVTLNDSDEFLLYNHKGGNMTTFTKWMVKAELNMENSSVASSNIIKQLPPPQLVIPKMIPPTPADSGALIHYIRHEQQAGLDYYQQPCIGVPRLLFGAANRSSSETNNQPLSQQEDEQEEQYKNVPNDLIPLADRLNTLRWRNHAERNDFARNSLGKVILDVSRIDVANAPYFESLHRPIKKYCGQPWQNDWDSGLRINHYLGSWDSYSFRDDARRGGERSREQWLYKSTAAAQETDDNIRPWLSGFVELHGSDKAMDLLEDAGLPENYHHHRTSVTKNELNSSSSSTDWNLLPEKLAEAIYSESRGAQIKRFNDWIREQIANGAIQPPKEGIALLLKKESAEEGGGDDVVEPIG